MNDESDTTFSAGASGVASVSPISRIAGRSAIYWLDDATVEPEAGVLGGKATPLVRLLAAGLPVPPGFVVAADALPPPAGHTGTREDALPDLAPEVQEQIREAYVELGRRLGQPSPLVAVRSSATVEDLDVASFAGQYETSLGVRGAEDVVAHVARCWASLWAAPAVQYRQAVEARTGRDLPAPAMAVLVQALVAADAAGVAFTADPISGDRSAVVINAAWGLGQSIVDGEVEADTWTVDRGSRRIVRQTTGYKPHRTGLGPDAVPEPVPEDRRRVPCLTPDKVAAVVDLALAAETEIGAPADVEWALAGKDLWLLQARPITTGVTSAAGSAAAGSGSAGNGRAGSGETGTSQTGPAAETPAAAVPPQAPAGPSPSFPFAWPSDDAPGLHWTLRSIDQRHSEALRPLEIEVRRHFNRSRAHAAAIKGAETASRSIYLNGYEYLTEVSLPYSADERERRRSAFQRPADALHERGESYFGAVVEPEVDAGNARLAAVDVDALEPDALAAHLEDALRWYERSWTLHWLWAENGPADRFSKLYKEITGDERRESATALLTHESNLLTDAIDRLVDLARIVQRHPPLRARIAEAPPVEVVAALASPETFDRLEGGAAFRARFDELIERQGLRCGAGFGTEQNQCLPGWREDPTIVVALVQRYVSQDLDAVEAARLAAIQARDARVEGVRARIADPEQQRQFDFWLAAGRRAQQAFEDHNYKIDSAASSLLHLAITGCARRLVAAGTLDDLDDVWWLEAHELALAVRGLSTPRSDASSAANTTPLAHWRDLAAARRALHRWQQSLTPPKTLGAPPPERKPDTPERAAEPPKPAPPAEALVTGQTGSAGVATGRVRLADRNALVPDVAPGDVLVAHNAGPLWTPIFPVIAAVVLDEGVLFQHAMLTCREYGVPAIFQTKDATARLHEGQRVTVDATSGWVLPAEPVSPA